MKFYERPGKVRTIMIEPLAENPFLLSCYAPESTPQELLNPPKQTIHEKMLDKFKAILTELGVCEVVEQKIKDTAGRAVTPPIKTMEKFRSNSIFSAVASTSENLLDNTTPVQHRIEHVDIEEWTPQDVGRWLEYLDDEEVLTSKTFLLENGEKVKPQTEDWLKKTAMTSLFTNNDICGETLMELDTKDLRDLGFGSGQTNYLMNEIARIKKRRGSISFQTLPPSYFFKFSHFFPIFCCHNINSNS